MKKYFFVAFKALNKGYVIDCGWFVIACSCCFGRMYEAILNCYNKNAPQKADGITITSLTVLDKQTAAQLSNNFTNSALIIDDGEKEDEQEDIEVGLFLARDKNNSLFLYFDNNVPKKQKTIGCVMMVTVWRLTVICSQMSNSLTKSRQRCGW